MCGTGRCLSPTAFCSYNGEALDAKTPLLRSSAGGVQAGRAPAARFGGTETVSRIIPMVGAEQEYFLVDYKLYDQRLDLKIWRPHPVWCKALQGGRSWTTHYCGRIRIRVGEFMQDLDKNLWEMGRRQQDQAQRGRPGPSTSWRRNTPHANIACDHNQLIMETMRTISKKHGLACLLHEKPFANVNGSGKHNNLFAVHRHR